ncbi:MAG TPA: hypothetical protein VFO10_28155 [Oligoflexus sp.]|uniref:hypothetical protein n=1 Tax=Oligoflexus sp. TaxID=1971216 RepID=UPI002D8000AA|nr:hypothetical protein [Oligoflexus sp.]HET9241171.1 hypothetical protein [Oligoflexus sp.]
MTMFSNVLDQLYYGPNISGGMGGCKIAEGAMAGPGFCTAYPSVFPYFGETNPTVEYFKVANSKTTAADLTADEFERSNPRAGPPGRWFDFSVDLFEF